MMTQPEFDAWVKTKKAELGNLVNPLAFGATSGAVCEMADLSDLEVELDITERDVSKVAKGMLCKVRAEAYPTREYNGVVDRLMPIANRAKNLTHLLAAQANPGSTVSDRKLKAFSPDIA